MIAVKATRFQNFLVTLIDFYISVTKSFPSFTSQRIPSPRLLSVTSILISDVGNNPIIKFNKKADDSRSKRQDPSFAWAQVFRHIYLGEIMNGSELDQACHTITEGDENEPIQRRCVVYFWQVGPRVDGQC